MGLPIFDLSEVGRSILEVKLIVVAVEALVLWIVPIKRGQMLLPGQVGRLEFYLTDLFCEVGPDHFGGLVEDLLASGFQVFDLICQLFRECRDWGLDGVFCFLDWLYDWRLDFRFALCLLLLLCKLHSKLLIKLLKCKIIVFAFDDHARQHSNTDGHDHSTYHSSNKPPMSASLLLCYLLFLGHGLLLIFLVRVGVQLLS